METIRTRSHIKIDGILRVQMPSHYQDQLVEVVVVVQPVKTEQQNPHKSSKILKKSNNLEAVAGFRLLRQEILPSNSSVREMIEEGRRF